LIRCANAGSVLQKTLASALADAFFKTPPRLAGQAQPDVSKPILKKNIKNQMQGHLRSKISDGVLESRASSLVEGFESTAPAWLAQALPCSFIRVYPGHPWFKKKSKKAILHNAPNSADAVFPIDLFAFGVGAAVVGDGDFVNADAFFGELGCDLGLEAEAVFLDGDGLQNFPAHGFVAGLHIREVQVGEHVGHEREELVPQGVPKIQHAVLLRPNKARSKNRIGLAAQNGMQQDRILCGIIFQVGILDNNHIRCRLRDSRSQRRALALVFLVMKDTQPGIRIFDTLQFLPSAIRRRIVHHNQLGN